MLRRSFRTGNSHTRREFILDGRFATRVARGTKAVCRLAQAVVGLPVGP